MYIPHVSSNVSSMYPRTSADTCISFVSRMYPACIQRISNVQDTYILMYLMCIPKCILDSFGIRVKYMQNVKVVAHSR